VQVLFKKKQANLIVSLTTYSSRIHTVHHTINSLLKQELLPKKIILWLDEKEFTSDTIPDSLKAISSSIFEICYCANLRSYKKLIPTLEKYPNETIITVDDDFEYPATLVADLCKYSNFYPGHVVAARGRIINRVDNSVAPYPSWTFISQEHALSGEHCLIPIGYGGVLYPAGCFDNKITDEDEFMSLAPNADDLWFKAMSWLNGTPVVVIPISCSIKMKTIDGTQESALYLTHNAGDANTEQMKALINRFPALGHKLNSPDFYDCKSNIKFLLGQQQLIALGKEAKDKVVDIRNAALFLEQQQPGLAMQLLFLASKLKPEGAFIKEKLAALRSRLSK